MADSIFGDIANMAGGALGTGPTSALGGTISNVLSDDAFKSVNEQLQGMLTPLMHSALDQDSSVSSELVQHLHDVQLDIVDALPDHGADNSADSSHATSLHALDAHAVEEISSTIDSLTQSALAKVGSDDAATAAQGQAELQQLQQVIESVTKIVQQDAEVEKNAIDGLHSDADFHDATVVAVADYDDAHGAMHADGDTSYAHASDHDNSASVHVDATVPEADGVA